MQTPDLWETLGPDSSHHVLLLHLQSPSPPKDYISQSKSYPGIAGARCRLRQHSVMEFLSWQAMLWQAAWG